VWRESNSDENGRITSADFLDNILDEGMPVFHPKRDPRRHTVCKQFLLLRIGLRPSNFEQRGSAPNSSVPLLQMLNLVWA
jgi:hypothetical protein